jgi:hypothetical protein
MENASRPSPLRQTSPPAPLPRGEGSPAVRFPLPRGEGSPAVRFPLASWERRSGGEVAPLPNIPRPRRRCDEKLLYPLRSWNFCSTMSSGEGRILSRRQADGEPTGVRSHLPLSWRHAHLRAWFGAVALLPRRPESSCPLAALWCTRARRSRGQRGCKACDSESE